MSILKTLKSPFLELVQEVSSVSKKESVTEKFQEGVYQHAFPGGNEQINTEATILEIALRKRYPHEFVRSLLIDATGKFYFQMLPPAIFNRSEFIQMLATSKNIDELEAASVCNFIQIKFKEGGILKK